MSGNHQDKNNESIDGFNLSKEELMNCFGSQICSQSSGSNYENQEDYNPSDIQRKNIDQKQFLPSPQQNKELNENANYSKKVTNYVNKDDLLRNICHGFVDMFFSQKEELKGIKDEIKKLQNLMINNNCNNINKKPITKRETFKNHSSFTFNQNNNENDNEGFNYSFKKSKKNNSFIEEQINQINLPKKENKKEPKRFQFINNAKGYRAKSLNIQNNISHLFQKQL